MVNTKNQPLADELGCFYLFRSKWNCVVAVNSLQHRGLKCDFYSLGGFLFYFVSLKLCSNIVLYLKKERTRAHVLFIIYVLYDERFRFLYL